jgi:hypothetical protein
MKYSLSILRCELRTVIPKGGLVVIEKISMMNPMDIAVCTIRLTDEAPTSANFQKSISIDTTPPAKDEKYVAVGYAGMDVEQEVKNGIGAGTGTFRFSVEWRPGDVVQVFPSRGPRNEPTSCFQLNVAFDSGMSGGPLLKVSHFPELVAGGIVGRASSFTEAGQLGSGDLALARPLWLSMAIPVKIEAPPNGIERVLFVELVRRGIVDDRGDALSHIRIDAQRCNGGTVVTWSS